MLSRPLWDPIWDPGAEHEQASWIGAGRRVRRRDRGPAELWERFDEAVAELDRVSEGRSIRAVGRAYFELAEVASELAAAVEREDRVNGLLPAEARKRRKSA